MDGGGNQPNTGDGGRSLRHKPSISNGLRVLATLYPTDAPTIEHKRAEIQLRRLWLRDPAAYLDKVEELKARIPAPRQVGRRRPYQHQSPRLARTVPVPDLTVCDERRLWDKIDRRGDDECWPWTAALSSDGYGRFKIGGKLYSPHRVVHAITAGPICDVPEYHGSVVMHRCDNPSCCNPRHLRLGTQADNVIDMDRKGRRRSPVFGSPLPTMESAR